jgi:hypothetical protein
MKKRAAARAAGTAKTKTKTKAKASRRTRRRKPLERLDHDEPIIADNGNVEIDFKHPPEDFDAGKRWVRRYTTFSHLIAKFDDDEQDPIELKPVSEATFTYAKPNGNPKDEELVFTSTGVGVVVATVSADKFKRKSIVQRHVLVPSSLRGLRLRKFTGRAPNGDPVEFDLFNGDEPKYRNVRFTIHATRHR